MNIKNPEYSGFRKMLFVTKFEELGFDALESLLVLRRAGLNHVILMNVVERENVAMHRGLGYNKDEERKLREQANIRFIDWAESLFERGMEVGEYIVVGDMVHEVIDASCEENADLIVIGKRGKSRSVMEFFYSGDDIVELLRRSKVPVLIYKHQDHSTSCLSENPFERTLLAVDWSPASLSALGYLKTLKNVVNDVSVVHVASPDELKGTSNMDIQKVRKEKRGRLEKICETLLDTGLSARSHLYVGEPAKELNRAAREFNATMIIMGSSGTPVWTERWLGSKPRKMVEKSPYPVLIVPQPRNFTTKASLD